jgi:hypothetical protein
VINAHSAEATQITDLLNNHPDHAVVIVNALILADDVHFKLKHSASANAGVNLLKYGKYDVTVTYSCDGALHQLATQGPLFFKGSQVQLTNDGKLEVIAASFDFHDIAMPLGFYLK